eukprot:CAMPEP_0204172534 /NCGR_PEP_ID=MMETSP0361-20130328/44193_1 /ASSEMBLY_ACC=CAM_ASM_000343 /TAXON_ID=268821 /ORGANISM="Scrippsiella Hangoei, Strain SHTV-5" /LENGTH=96 /DNA_ID=CAMNT_0051130637 /DNA_START=105 /DNA_END=393 /DNA_ORIENTATION=-
MSVEGLVHDFPGALLERIGRGFLPTPTTRLRQESSQLLYGNADLEVSQLPDPLEENDEVWAKDAHSTCKDNDLDDGVAMNEQRDQTASTRGAPDLR